LHLVHQWVTKVLGGKVNVISENGLTVFVLTIPINVDEQGNPTES